MTVFCSTVIPTIARPSLSRAVRSVLEQEFSAADFEVIVVNDSGRPLGPMVWRNSDRVRVISTNCRDKSVARNTGAAVAKGEYLHFLDDDDWLLPGALESFWRLASDYEMALLYGSSQLVDRKGNLLIQLRHDLTGNCFTQVMAGEWIPTGAYAVDAGVFFAVGGYNPLMPVAEDIDLCRRVALRGCFASTSDVVVCVGMGKEGSSADYDLLSECSRWARESILDEASAFTRMCDSAHTSYWRGRIVRAYATSAVWNLQRRRLFVTAGRTTLGLKGLALSGRHLLSGDFWRAVTRPYESFAFSRGFQEADSVGQPVTARIEHGKI